ncbi:Ger(x)C family spore germination protein [Paenibacillaceae bacterium]|nr:Ger(x)C family spore germination protein [Paenibacillaceae bacterium]
MRGRKLPIILALCCLCGLTGCWDLVQINELAIGSLAGGDIDPETKQQIVYYHIINPSAVSSQRGSGIKAPVYTYRVEAPTIAELSLKSSNLIPRELFPDHLQSHIVTERFAKQGLGTFINFIERQFNRRTDLYLLVTDSSMADVMDTFTLLERVPGRYVRSLVEYQAKVTSTVSLKSRVKDLIENMESSRLTVLPIITLHDSKAASNTSRYENIDASKGTIFITGGAVFKKDKMIGRLDLSDVSFYHLLKGDAKVFYTTIKLRSGPVDLYATKLKTKKRLSLVSGRPVWEVTIRTKLIILNNEQKVKLSPANIVEIKNEFNEQIKTQEEAFFEKYKTKGWDLFGLEESIKNKRGKDWAEAREDKNLWRKAAVKINVNSRISDVGGSIDPYQGSK